MTPEELVGRRIAEIRERCGLTQQQLGEQLEPLLGKPWPRQTVSAAEKGRRAFTAAELLAIAEVLDTWVGRLFVMTASTAGEIEMPSGAALDRERLNGASRSTGDTALKLAVLTVREAAARIGAHSAEGVALVEKLTELEEELTN